MPKMPLMLMLPPILLSLLGCVTRTVASQVLPKEAPLSKALQVPGPNPLLFEKCKTETLAQTSAQELTSSCLALRTWRLSTPIGSSAD